MRHTFTHFLFTLLLSNIIGVNAIRWMDSHTSVAAAPDSMTQVMEIEDATEESEESTPFWSAGGNDDCSDFPPASGVPELISEHEAVSMLIRSVSIRQSQINLRNSLQAPALFILFHSYQGYLS